ncbi:MAG TPA: Rrf2 family transcriptional regulator [Candidatus Omnitrophota bacterium]|nr:Rrf2 family transcriptional regulator [Candidatus Omnitrophota bacterium]
MKKSTKFSDVLHILLHMAGSRNPARSETLAKSAQTNPVVVRRIMAGLRERGFVQSEKGHGGGWSLSCDLKKVTLYDVYDSIGAPTMLALGNRAESSKCLVEKAVNTATGHAFREAESLLIANFRNTTLADVHSIIKKYPRGHAKRK